MTDENRVRKIDETGNVKTIFSNQVLAKNHENLDAYSPQLFGLDVDRQNNVLAADFANNRLLKINSDGAVSTFFTSEKDWSLIGVATFGDEVYVLEGRPFTASVHTGNRVLKIASSGKTTVIANLAERNKPIENPKLNSNNMFTKTEASNSIASVNVNGIKTTVTSQLGFYGIVGALSAAFIALVILVKRK